MPGPFDALIVGGGPAGLSAALVLGRCRRRVLLCDAGAPRNRAARALHGYLTRDGVAPAELLRLGREELHVYGVDCRRATVTALTSLDDGFRATLDDGPAVRARTVLIATGVADRLPAIPGLADCYGISVHHCPYCDGWEVRDRAILVLGAGAAAAALALSLRTWSAQVTVCTHGRGRLPAAHAALLARWRVPVYEQRVTHVTHEQGQVQHTALAGGAALRCESIFVTFGQQPACDLPRQLGCSVTRLGVVRTDRLGRTGVPGLYVAGDASRDVQFAIVAAAEGAKAGVAINTQLQTAAGQVPPQA